MSPAQTSDVTTYDGIPISNLWLLMLYASDLFRTLGETWTEREDMPDDVPDLVAEILAYFVEQRLRRNLSFGYRLRTADLSRVRGRIDHLRTASHRLLDKGRVACRFDEFTVDTRRNRYVRCALERLTTIVGCKKLAKRCRSLAASLRSMGVLGDKPTRAEISLERFGRHDADDRQMVAAAHLAFQLAMPMDAFGDQNLLDPGRDSTWLRKLFEHAVAGLYEVALPREHWRVRSGTKLRWQTADATDGMNGILPGMQTDIVLDHLPSVHRTVIDTKFTSIVKKGQYGQMKLKSGYIYQLYTYLRS